MERVLIGFLAARLDEPYQHAVWRGAAEEAERIGTAIVFFGGQRVGSPVGYEALDNIAFDLAARSHVAGLAVMTNVIGTYLSGEELLQFIGRFSSVPVVSVGVDIPGVPSVRINNQGGMIAVADHLVKVHKRSRFLFLAGPAGHSESIGREREFAGVLTSSSALSTALQSSTAIFRKRTPGRLLAASFGKRDPSMQSSRPMT
jgi:DNA-binding LacI/PurR family transcriptional regulator